MPVAPIGVYEKTKAVGEAAVLENINEYYIIRIAGLYGGFGKNFVYTMIIVMYSYDIIKIVDNQKIIQTFAADLADVIIQKKLFLMEIIIVSIFAK